MATINEALKKLFLGLGGDPDELKDNNTVSDYIDDLESAIETAASGASAELIDDEEASSTKTYSSTKIESLIPENELPTPAAADIGKVVSVVTDGDEGAEYALELPENELPTPAVGDIGKVVSVVSDGESGAEYSLETPASGGDVNNECVIMVTKTGSQMYVNPQGDLTRADILNYLSSSSNDFARMNINAYIYYANDDFTVNASGMVMLNSAIIGANAKLPVFSGIITPQSNSSGSLYQAVFILGATSADDRLEIIPLTTT